jgi:hypothetical protein
MSKQVILSMLAQGNTGAEIMSILDAIVTDIEQEGIDSCAEVFANWLTLTVHSLTNTQAHNMSKQVMISMLAQSNNGNELLSMLDVIVSGNVAGYDYNEGQQIESALGIPTLEEIAFWV